MMQHSWPCTAGEEDSKRSIFLPVAELKVTDKGGVEVKLIDRIRALESSVRTPERRKRQGAAELLSRVLTEAAAGEEGGWDDG